jgi:virulence factor
MKIGIIGLGDIAEKAYLPILSSKKVEVHLCSRSKSKLSEAVERFRFQQQHDNLDSLIGQGIHAAFVHSPAVTHGEIVEKLLLKNVHVYVDKPLALNYTTAEHLVNLARKRNLILRVGFNRRYAPAYASLKELTTVNMIIMQKNRISLPGEVRNFIFEDFIHVIDTLLFLFARPFTNLIVQGKEKGGILYHVGVQLISADGDIAMGIMNRDAGTTEEKLEIFTPTEKTLVSNLTDTITFKGKNQHRPAADDWASTLFKRGFPQIVEGFLQNVDLNSQPAHEYDDISYTHKICEQIVHQLEHPKLVMAS